MSIFKSQRITKSDGTQLDYVIDCDDLTDAELGVFANIILARYPNYGMALSPPSHHGSAAPRLAHLLRDTKSTRVSDSSYTLIIDDVVTTGATLEALKQQYIEMHNKYSSTGIRTPEIIGVTLFQHYIPDVTIPDWIHPIFDQRGFYHL